MPETSQSGKTLKKTGIALILIGYLLFGILHKLFVKNSENLAAITIDFIPIIIIIVGTILFFRGRQHAAKEIAANALSEGKSQVLYLRAFRSDATLLEQAFVTINGLFGALTTTAEEQLVEVLQQIGTVVAIGQPGESLPKPGAARLYASDEEWKKVVTDKMKTSQLVVLRAGKGEGLLWELKQALEIVNPKKLLILVLDMKKKQYESFRKDVSSLIVAPLPETAAISRAGRVSGFISFSNDWQPNFLPLRAPFFRTPGHKPHRCFFTFALKPVFEDFGLEWREPSISPPIVSAIVILAAIFGINILLGIYLIYWWSQHFPDNWMSLTVTVFGLQLLVLPLAYLLYRRGQHRPSLWVAGAVTLIGHQITISTIIFLTYQLGQHLEQIRHNLEQIRHILQQ
jgi:hypothetical protein